LQNFIGFTFRTELHHRIAKCQFGWNERRLLFVSFTFRTELHNHIAIVGHRSFSSVSHFEPNYIIPNYITALPSLPIVTFHWFRIFYQTMVIAPFHRFHISHRTTSSHCKISSVSHLAPNYIIALQNANLDEMSDGNVNAVSGQFDEWWCNSTHLDGIGTLKNANFY
jgi:hypothetical protein